MNPSKSWRLLWGSFFTILFVFTSACASAQGPDCRQALELKQTASAGLATGPRVYLPAYPPQNVQVHLVPSQALRDPLLEEARKYKITDDFKTLADLTPRPLSPTERARISKIARFIETKKGHKAEVEYLVRNLYEHVEELKDVSLSILDPQVTVPSSAHKATFDYIEHMWHKLVRRTPPATESSLIPLPYPELIPGSRFQEGYYWDSFFAMPALIATGRIELAKMQIENFLFLISHYGLVPNGARDYYLSRSQPPLLTQMVRLVLESEMKQGGITPHTLQWLRDKAYPLMRKDYLEFWMNPATRYDASTHLNHDFDALNTPRPERHSTDKEEQLGKTYRDVRAEAESGKDFNGAYNGEATHVAGVLLNSVLFQVEKDLSWMAGLTGNSQDQSDFLKAAEKRKEAMNTYLWDGNSGSFRDYNLRTQSRSGILTADNFAALYTELATPEQAQAIVSLLPRLEREGGIASSDTATGKQWDFPNGWAPHHFFAISGLAKYHYLDASRRLAQKWVDSNDRIFKQTGKLIEKIDAETGNVPNEPGDRYPTQEGFLWTNGVYVWALTQVLGAPLQPITAH